MAVVGLTWTRKKKKEEEANIKPNQEITINAHHALDAICLNLGERQKQKKNTRYIENETAISLHFISIYFQLCLLNKKYCTVVVDEMKQRKNLTL